MGGGGHTNQDSGVTVYKKKKEKNCDFGIPLQGRLRRQEINSALLRRYCLGKTLWDHEINFKSLIQHERLVSSGMSGRTKRMYCKGSYHRNALEMILLVECIGNDFTIGKHCK